MKRKISALAVLALLLALLPGLGLAADDSIKLEMTQEVRIANDTPNPPVLTITNQSPHDITVTIEVYDEHARGNVAAMQYTILQGEAPLLVPTQVYKALQRHGEVNTYRYKVTSAGGFKKTLYFAQIMYIDRNTKEHSYVQWENPAFPRNNVCSFGPQFRVLAPQLTKDWYMFTPIDLSLQGRQTFELVGGNMYNVGELYVDVYGDTVNVTYKYHFLDEAHNKLKPLSEYLYFFPSFDAVKSTKPEDNPSPFAFGLPFSIANQLGGDTNVLMFVRNQESFYRFPAPKVEMRRNYPSNEVNRALRQQMLDLMDPVPGLVLVNEHNYKSK